jgi:diguanylate cyclase (GGDEF)-like protein/PAS domain S-box-containing protein
MRVIPGDGHGDDRSDVDGQLLRLGHAVAAAERDADVLRIAVEGIEPLLESTCAAVVLSEGDGSLVVAACAGECGDYADAVRAKRFSLSADALAADAVLTGSYAVEREPFSPERHALVDLFPGRDAIRAVAAVPIHSPQGTIGVFLLFSDRDTAFGSRRMESLRVFAGVVALEIHRRRRLASLLAERADTKTMLEEAKALSRFTEERALLAEVVAHCRMWSAASFGVAWDLHGNLFEPAVIDGDDAGFARDATINADASSPLGQGPEGKATRTGAIEVVKDAHADRSYAPWLAAARESHVRSILALPLSTGDGDAVVIGLYAPDVDAFDEKTIAHLAAYAGHARIALETARAFGAAEREARERALQASAGATVTRSLDLGEVARSIARTAGESTGASFAVTYVGDRETLSIAGSWNAPANLRLIMSFGANDQSMAAYPPAQAAQTRRVLVFNDVATDGQWLRQGWDQQALVHGFNAVVAVPLHGEKSTGAVVMFFPGSAQISDPEAAALMRLGLEGAAAIEAARRYERARSARDFLNRVLEESTDAIVQIDLHGDVVGWNSGAERMYGLTRDGAIGSKFSDMSIVPPESRDAVREMFSRVARGEQVRALEVPCRSKAAGPTDMLLSATPSRDEEGNIVGLVAFSKDITEQKKQYGQLVEQNRRLTAIREITRAFGREVGLAPVAQMGLNRLLETQRLEAGRIYVLDEAGSQLVNVAQRGFTADGCEPIDVGPSTTGGEGALSTAVFYRQTMVLNDVEGANLEHPHFADRSAGEVSSVMTKPLAVGERVIGALQTIGFDGRRLTFDDQSLMHAIADELAASMHAAQLLEEASRMAITDPLTGLYNYRFAHDFLKKRLSEARRRRRPFSVIMADVDGLQAINERHGRHIGDEVLREFGRCLGACVRLSDVVARYGGDEFIVLLPETQLGDALMLAERMAQAFAARDWEKPVEDIELTASMGCAAFPESGSHAQMLLRAADAALYQAKKSGKNTIFPRADSLPRFAG